MIQKDEDSEEPLVPQHPAHDGGNRQRAAQRQGEVTSAEYDHDDGEHSKREPHQYLGDLLRKCAGLAVPQTPISAPDR
jgi:hypothetical protein